MFLSPGWVTPTVTDASVRVVRYEGCNIGRCNTIHRVWKVRPSQTRSRHCGELVRVHTKVTKERCTAPDWKTEQGKTFALGSGRITCQNPDVVSQTYSSEFEYLAKTFYSLDTTSTRHHCCVLGIVFTLQRVFTIGYATRSFLSP